MKGITFIEQHVEKLIVALLAVLLLAVLAMQFLTSPNRISMGGEEVDPSGIEERLRAKAFAINERLKKGADEEPLVTDGIPKLADDFSKDLETPISPAPKLPAIDHGLANSLLTDEVSGQDAEFHVPRFAPLAMMDVRQEHATISEGVVAASPELKALVAGAGETDVTWAIPVAKVDLKALRSELRASPGASIVIPDLWYNGNLYLVDVVFERQELGEDGWGEAAVVPTLPGSFSLRKEIASKPDAVLRDEVFRLLASRERALSILQPAFLETVREVFTPGSILGDASAADPGESDEVRRVRRSLAAKSANLARVEADLKELGGPLRGADDKDTKKKDDKKDDSGGSGGGGTKTPGGGMGFGSGTTGGKRGTSGSAPDDEASRTKRRLLTAQFDRLTNEVNRLKEDLDRLSPGAQAVAASDDSDLSKADEILVWVHDLGVKPGVSYRYRATLLLYNPFFARSRQLSANQAGLAEAFTLATAVSEWSTPLAMEPEVSFFLVDAGLGEGRLGLGTAKFEVFRYEDGERRRETFVVQPGERIGEPREAGTDKSETDFGTEWFVVDVVEGIPGDGRADAKGRNARVLVADDRGRTVYRSPLSDLGNPSRRKFNDEVEDARLLAATPSTDPKGQQGGSAPPMTPAGGPAGGPTGGPAGK